MPTITGALCDHHVARRGRGSLCQRGEEAGPAPRPHKQIHLDRIAWSKGARYADCGGGREKMNYLRDTCQRRSPRSIPPPPTSTHLAFHAHPPNPRCRRRVSSATVSMHASRAPASKCIHLFRAPRRNHSVLLSFFFFLFFPSPLSSPAVQMEFA